MIVVTVISPQVSSRLNRLILAAVLLALLPTRTLSLDQVLLGISTLHWEDWQLEGVELDLHLAEHSSGQDRFSLKARQLSHPSLNKPITNLRLHCGVGAVDETSIRCEQGTLELTHPWFQKGTKSNITLNFNYILEQYEFTVNKISTDFGELNLNAAHKEGEWNAQLNARKISLERLLSHQLFAQTLKTENLQLNGNSDLQLDISGKENRLLKASWETNFTQLGFQDGSESYLGESLAGKWQGSLSRVNGNWRARSEMSLRSGAILTPHFYLEPTTGAVSLQTSLVASDQFDTVTVTSFDFSHPEHLKLEASGQIATNPDGDYQLREFRIDSDPLDLKTVYGTYLAPVLISPTPSDLQLTGKGHFSLEIKDSALKKASLVLQETHIELLDGEGGGTLALYNIDGDLQWTDQGEVSASRLRWDAGHLFGSLEIGASDLEFKLRDNRFALIRQAGIPVLDGSLEAEKLDIVFDPATGTSASFKGYLTPISMDQFSESMGWPILSGQLSGMIPGVSYDQGIIQINGIALIKVFGGEVLLKGLRLEDLFGVLPVLVADVELKNLDLETLTKTFSFGKITGKLEGKINRLRLEDWQPVSFDARFATPEQDSSRHRISQRAVDNISNLGGAGVSGALSRSFLRIFKEFGYSRLGISCRLKNNICEMGGIEPATRGYYLVKGGGIPRIDILGFNTSTDWTVLVDKLKQISQGESPVIE